MSVLLQALQDCDFVFLTVLLIVLVYLLFALCILPMHIYFQTEDWKEMDFNSEKVYCKYMQTKSKRFRVKTEDCSWKKP